MSPSILFAEFHPWHANVKVGGHHYAEQFAKDGWRVLWLANFLNLNRLIRRDEYDRLYWQAWKNGVQSVDRNIYTYTPFPIIPYLDMPALSSLAVARNSLRWCWPSLRGKLARNLFDPVDVLWISQPRLYSLVHTIRYKSLVYRMFDDVKYFSGEPNSICQVEEWLCRQADKVFATSHYLVEKASRWSQNVVYLPNAADVDRYQTKMPIPAEYARIPAPRLLYVGAIAEWFDFDLIIEAAKLKPEWSFVMVGPWSSTVKSLSSLAEALPNLHYLGPKPAAKIPAYNKHADLGLIPFKVNDLTHSVSPIKLFEYSAAGLPVVAPRLHEIEGYAAPILYYENSEQFITAIGRGLNFRQELREEILRFGRENSWEFRYKTVREHLRQ